MPSIAISPHVTRLFDILPPSMSSKLLVPILLIGAVFITACSDSAESEYLDIYRELIVEHTTTSTTLGAGPTFDFGEGSAGEIISDRLQELRIAAAEFNVLQFRWLALEPPADFRVHYDLVVQLLGKSNEAMTLAVEAFQEMDRQLDNAVPDTTDANVLIQRSQKALAEADAFGSAANRERDRLGN